MQIAAALGFTLAARAGEQSNELIRVALDLADGSHLIGTATAPTVTNTEKTE